MTKLISDLPFFLDASAGTPEAWHAWQIRQVEATMRAAVLDAVVSGRVAVADIEAILTRLVETDWSATVTAHLDESITCFYCKQTYPRRTFHRADSRCQALPDGQPIQHPDVLCASCFAAAVDVYDSTELSCDTCHTPTSRGELRGIAFFMHEQYAKPGRYCATCYPAALTAYRRSCRVCGQDFRIGARHSSMSVCPNCTRDDVRDEMRRLDSQLARAREAGVAATLALNDWLDCLDYFAHKCAYCEHGDAQVLEHIQPISAGGGTTAENCVPACYSCNAQKGAKYPLASVFPAPVVARIEEYQANVKMRLHPANG